TNATATAWLYTLSLHTLFRSAGIAVGAGVARGELVLEAEEVEDIERAGAVAVGVAGGVEGDGDVVDEEAAERSAHFVGRLQFERSEEHTSELQSRENLVCRLP